MEELFRDTYTVSELDRGGKQFDNLSRIYAESDSGSTIILDVNCELFAVSNADTFQLVLSKSESAQWDPALFERFRDVWEYVMHGKVYKYEDREQHMGTIHVSCGGLLLALSAKHRDLTNIRVGSDVFVQVSRG